jgi:hypothetical protein
VPAISAGSGTLTARPLRPDWDEQTVSWFQPGIGGSWGGAGATLVGTDIGSDAFTLSVPDTTLVASLAMDPEKWPAGFIASDTVAVLTEFLLAGARKQFIAIMQEALISSAMPKSVATLTSRYCP